MYILHLNLDRKYEFFIFYIQMNNLTFDPVCNLIHFRLFLVVFYIFFVLIYCASIVDRGLAHAFITCMFTILQSLGDRDTKKEKTAEEVDHFLINTTVMFDMQRCHLMPIWQPFTTIIKSL